ncbi:S2-RNase [Pyrus ussuriensis x Pyrus communis]|uniref:S2-RNase n=1 Tax=Pyrus ussuriensis x Pyrus communis TaxID=2448454 RepID=A0A5N5FTV7_9ROSA|nr:S2-RNase [Pyrus ussuriensis x Pyrus communis]
MKGKVVNPVTKKNLDGKPVKEIGPSMIRRVQRQHKAHMNSFKVPTTSKTSKNVKSKIVPHEERNQPYWRSKNELKKPNSKNEGEGNHMQSNPHPGKYRILRRAQEDMIMMPTPRWSPKPICFGTISPEKGLPTPMLIDIICEVPKQLTSTYRALLGKDWIHQSLSEMMKAESRSFLPTTNILEANFYNPSVGILQCSGADKNDCPTKDLPENPKLVEFLCAEPDKPALKVSGLLETKDRARIVNLLHEFKDSFVWHYTKMPGLNPTLVEHRMPIKEGFKPVKQAPRRMSKEIEEKVNEEIERLVNAGFIKPAKYIQWLAKILPVLKAITKAVRCCVNYRNINGAMPKDEYPMPMADLSIDAVAKHKVLSFMDGNAGYNKIKMAKEDIHKTAFRCPGHVGAYEYLVMPFGLKNTGATYQRAINTIFHDLIDHSMEYVPQRAIKGQAIADSLAEHQKTSKWARTRTTPYALTFGQDVVIPMEINVSFKGKEAQLISIKKVCPKLKVKLRSSISRQNDGPH